MNEPCCPLCGAETVAAFRVGDRNRGLSDELFAYRRCLGCGSFHLVEPPADLGRYYASDYYALPPEAELDRRAEAEAPKLELLRPFAPGGALIDVGAGTGLFARAARNAGYDVTAIEMDKSSCEYLERVVGVRTIQSDAPEQAVAAAGSAHVVTLWHVLEHVPRPWALLEAIAGCLDRGGIVAVAMPNPHSFQFRVLGGRWAHVDAPRHLFLIPIDALARRARELGLELKHVTSRDAAGRHWNRFGWEYALRGCPARRPASRSFTASSMVVTALLAPVELSGFRGTAYTAVFAKSDA